jgi:hypothetical protein
MGGKAVIRSSRLIDAGAPQAAIRDAEKRKVWYLSGLIRGRREVGAQPEASPAQAPQGDQVARPGRRNAYGYFPQLRREAQHDSNCLKNKSLFRILLFNVFQSVKKVSYVRRHRLSVRPERD